ncbi:helix-turn-helix transcriptional regulator [Kitasatospora sp. McL0602]|uniref:helix-turn-helix transcriptional regulator n=1 Tax=Kitasatospora sp. McL0602 TaxID=3439530 RepID=UPI003F89C4D7
MASQHSTRGPELAQFLRAMRARLQPEQVGLPPLGQRRTPGLRRQEVAQLAAVSIDWYIRLEQGRVGTPGAAVLDALATALLLSPSEHRHLHLIARGELPVLPPRPAPLGGSLRVLLDGMPLWPAYVIDHRFDVQAHNAAASALFGAGFGSGDAANAARLLFRSPATRESQLDWDRIARETVGNLRANLARHRSDPSLLALIDELRSQSAEFAAWWEDQTVRERAHGSKRILHPAVGQLTVCYDTLAVLQSPDHSLVVLTPADAPSEQALRTLVAAHTATRTATRTHPHIHALPAPADPAVAHSPQPLSPASGSHA